MDRKRRSGKLTLRLASYCGRHPWGVVVAWGMVIAVAVIVSLALSSKPYFGSELEFGSRPSAKAANLEAEKFGRAETLAVLLEGKRRSLDTHGPRAARALERLDGVDVVSPWTRGAPAELRRGAGRALLLLQVRAGFKDTGLKVMPRVRGTLAQILPSPVRATTTGAPSLAVALGDEGNEAGSRAEKFAIPFLAIVLLLVFRSPIAAAVPLVLGVSVITIGKGLLVAASHLVDLNAIAFSTLSVVGLALGVDYSLVVVSRFREELANGLATDEAVERSLAKAGRTVLSAAVVVGAGMVAVTLIVEESQLVSATTGGVVATALAAAIAMTLLPAGLHLLGPGINRWRIGRRKPRALIAPLVKRLVRRPLVVVALALAPLLALCVPALGLQTGPTHPSELSSANPEREAVERFIDRIGPGWVTPYEVVVAAREGPIATPQRLARLARFEDRLEADPGADAVVGPKPLAAKGRRIARTLASAGRLGSLDGKVRRAHRAASALREGMASADAGARALVAGSGQELAGLQALEAGLGATHAGSVRLTGGVASLKAAAERLASAAGEAAAGAGSISDLAWAFRAELDESKAQLDALQQVPDEAQASLERANDALAKATAASKGDPQVQEASEQVATALAAVSGTNPASGQRLDATYSGLSDAVSKARSGALVAATQARRLSRGALELAAGLERVRSGNGQLSRGTADGLPAARRIVAALGKAQAASTRLQGGAARLREGAGSLVAGLGAAGSGADKLRAGIQEGQAVLDPIVEGASWMQSGESKAAVNSAADDRTGTTSVSAGHALFAAVAGASGEERRNADTVVNRKSGGDAARFFVVPRKDATSEANKPFASRLRKLTAGLGKDIGGEAGVGGRAALIADYDSATEALRVPVVVILSVITFMFLVVVFRSVLLAAKAVALNLLVVGAAFGVTALLVQGTDPLVPGAGWMTALIFYVAYAAVFTLSLDYEVFMISRIREGYERTGSTELGINYGVEKTAGIVTGGAAIMLVVFAAFALMGAGAIRQLGIALAAAVIVDATLVRLILLPATMRLFKKANWWLPAWLDRRLPKVTT